MSARKVREESIFVGVEVLIVRIFDPKLILLLTSVSISLALDGDMMKVIQANIILF